jgi:hypothetical protein
MAKQEKPKKPVLPPVDKAKIEKFSKGGTVKKKG